MAENTVKKTIKDFKKGQKVKVLSVSYYSTPSDKKYKDPMIGSTYKVDSIVNNKFICLDHWYFLPDDLEIVEESKFIGLNKTINELNKVKDQIKEFSKPESKKKVDNYKLFGI